MANLQCSNTGQMPSMTCSHVTKSDYKANSKGMVQPVQAQAEHDSCLQPHQGMQCQMMSVAVSRKWCMPELGSVN